MKRALRGCLRSALVSLCGLALVLTAAALVLFGMLAADHGLLQSDEAYIAGIIGTALPAYEEKAGKDTHGGFHGDGSAWFVYAFAEAQAEKLEKEIAALPIWRSLPMSRTSECFLFGGEKDSVQYAAHAGTSGFSMPRKGYWFVVDEQAEEAQRHSDEGFLNRHSINVKFAVYDAEKNALLFYELDT